MSVVPADVQAPTGISPPPDFSDIGAAPADVGAPASSAAPPDFSDIGPAPSDLGTASSAPPDFNDIGPAPADLGSTPSGAAPSDQSTGFPGLGGLTQDIENIAPAAKAFGKGLASRFTDKDELKADPNATLGQKIAASADASNKSIGAGGWQGMVDLGEKPLAAVGSLLDKTYTSFRQKAAATGLLGPDALKEALTTAPSDYAKKHPTTALQDAAYKYMVNPSEGLVRGYQHDIEADEKIAGKPAEWSAGLAAGGESVAAGLATGGREPMEQGVATIEKYLQAHPDALSEGMNIAGKAFVRAAKFSAVPAGMQASETYSKVMDETNDPVRAASAAVNGAAVTVGVNTIPAGAEGHLLARVLTSAAAGPFLAITQNEANNTLLPADMQQKLTPTDLGVSSLIMALSGGAFGRRIEPSQEAIVKTYNQLSATAADPSDPVAQARAKKMVSLADDLSGVDGLSASSIEAAGVGVNTHDSIMQQSHQQLQANARYNEIYKAAIQSGIDDANAQVVAKQSYADEQASNASWDHYFAIERQAKKAGQVQKMAADVRNLYHQAKKIVNPSEMAKLEKWAVTGQRSPMEVNQALNETIANNAVPDYINDTLEGKDNWTHIEGEQHAPKSNTGTEGSPGIAPNEAAAPGGNNPGESQVAGGPGRIAVPAEQTNGQNPDEGNGQGHQPVQPQAAEAGGAEGAEGSGRPEPERNAGAAVTDDTPEPPLDIQYGKRKLGNGVAGLLGGVHRNTNVAEQIGDKVPVRSTGQVVLTPDTPAATAQQALDVAAHDTAANTTPFEEPTEGQIASGNYRKGGVLFKSAQGDLPVKIENPDGSTRHGDWGSRPIKGAHYGYIPGTISGDGQPVDVLVTRNAHDDTRPVHFINQRNTETGEPDEIKMVLGAKSKKEALNTYLRQYPESLHQKLVPNGLGDVTALPRAKAVAYLHSGATDVPPNPLSGRPMLKLRDTQPYYADFDGEDEDRLKDTLDALGKKHGVKLWYTGGRVSGDVPVARAAQIDKALRNEHGFQESSLEPAAAPAAKPAPEHGNPRPASGGQHAPEAPAPAGIRRVESTAPVYQEGQGAHPVRVVGVHYSPIDGLRELDPTKAGTGSAGGERRRYGMGNYGASGDPLTRMTHFYVREGKALPPKENEVAGDHAYETQLNNLYDVGADPDGIIEHAYNEGYGANKDRIVEDIHNAGYDGFVTKSLPGMKSKHFATVIGVEGKIPTEEVEAALGKRKPSKIKASAEKESLGRMLSDKTNEALQEYEEERHNKAALETFKGLHAKMMFLGEKSPGADHAQKERFKASEQSADAQTLRELTGWFRGRDGKLRYELPDYQAKIKPTADWSANAVHDMSKVQSDDEFYKDILPKAPTLDQVLDHPELFKHAPYLKKVKVIIDPSMPPESLGASMSNGDAIFIRDPSRYGANSPNLKESEPSLVQTLLHETQHIVQGHEGHAVGGDPNRIFRELSEKAHDFQIKLEAIRTKARKLADSGTDPDSPEVVALNAQYWALVQAAKMGHYFDPEDGSRYAQAQYLKSAGEVEARNIEKRFLMTPEQLKLSHPFETEDEHGGDDQIFHFDADGQAKSIAIAHNQASALFEVAPDPHNKELTERFAKLPMERRAEITHQLNESVTPKIMEAIGIKPDHYLSTYGGYGDGVNPSLGMVFKEGTPYEDVKIAAAVAGHVFNQDSTIAIGEGGKDHATRLRLVIDGPKDYNALSHLYAHLRATMGPDKISGFTGHDEGIDILNFNKDADGDALRKEAVEALKSYDGEGHVTVYNDHVDSDFIGKDDYESYRRGLSEDARQTLDHLRGSAAEELESAIEGKGKPGTEAGTEADHHQEIVAHVKQVTATLKHVPPTRVVATRADAPADVKAALDHMLPDGTAPRAIYHNGKVTVFSGEVPDKAAAERAILHELNGHFGLHGTFGDALPDLLDSIHASIKRDPAYRAIAKTYTDAYRDRGLKQFQRDTTEEYLATMAERPMNHPVWAKFRAWVRNWGRRMGLVSKWSDDDLKSMMADIAEDVRNGRVGIGGRESPQTIFDDQNGVAHSSYNGVAGRGAISVDENGVRQVEFPRVSATLHPSRLGGRQSASVSDLTYTSPKGLRDLAGFLSEEGKRSFAIGRGEVSKADLEASGLPYTRRLGFYEVNTPKVPDSPMLALRNRVKLDPDVQAVVDKAIDYSELNMTPWDRMQRSLRYAREHLFSDGITAAKAYVVDAAAKIDKLERAVNGGNLLDAAQSAYKMFWLSRNTQQIMAGVMRLGVPVYRNGSFVPAKGRQGLLDIYKPLYTGRQKLDQAFEAYATGVRANRLLHEFNADGTPKEKNLTQEDVNALLSLGDKYPVLKQVLAKQQTFLDNLLDLAVDRGSMDKDTAEKWKENIYVPFYRSLEQESPHHIGEGRSTDKVTAKALYGSEHAIQPVMENIIKNTSAILDRIYSNEARRRVVALGSLSGAVERVRMPLQRTWISANEAISMLKKAGIVVDKSNLTEDDLSALTSIVRPVRPLAYDVISTVENGKTVYWKVKDAQLLKSFDFLDKTDNTGKIGRFVLGLPKRIYTIGVTSDPRFMFKIMLRDAMTAWAQTGTNPNMLKDVFKNTKQIWTDGDFLNQLRLNGFNGNEYYKQNDLRSYMEKIHGQDGVQLLNGPKKLWQAYQRIGWTSEQLSRMRIAKHTLDHGGSMAEAAWQGQNTLNWQKQGSGAAMQFLIRTVPFLNPHVQGLTRIYDGATGRDVTQNRKRAILSFMAKAGAMATATMALQLHNEKDKRYERIPELAKDLYWHAFIGGHHFMLPKPFEFGATAATLPERTLRFAQGIDTPKQYAHAMYDVLGEMFGVDPIPQAIKPALEVATNHDFDSGHEIVNEREQELLPEDQSTQGTPATAKVIGSATGISPIKLDYLVKGYLGTMGTYLWEMADAGTRSANSKLPSKPTSRFGNSLVEEVAKTISTGPADTDPRNKYVQQVYAERAVADQIAATMKDYKSQHRQDLADDLANKYQGLRSDRTRLDTLGKELGQIYVGENKVYASDETPAQKRADLNRLNQRRVELLDRSADLLQRDSKYLSVLEQ